MLETSFHLVISIFCKVFGWFYFSINLVAFLSGLLTPFLLEARNSINSFGGAIYPYVRFMVGNKAENEIIFGPHYAFGCQVS